MKLRSIAEEKNIKKSFLERLDKSILICDGAMGTMLCSKGVSTTVCYNELNISNPKLVQEIHKSYIDAGAQIIETNTFGANRVKLSRYGLEKKVYEINFQGAQIAKEVAGRNIFVAGSVGPLGRPTKIFDKLTKNEKHRVFTEQIKALCDGGVDLIMIETFADLDEMKEAVNAAKDVTYLPIICQMTYGQEGKTFAGMDPFSAVKELSEVGVDVIGANCGRGPQDILGVIKKMASISNIKFSAQPNAGLPRFMDGQFIYPSAPEYFGIYAKRLVDAGANIVGGCCGTMPEHIKAIADAVKDLKPKPRMISVEIKHPTGYFKKPLIEQPFLTSLSKKFGKKFVVTVEIDPPKGVDVSKALEAAMLFKKYGVDAVNIADNPLARTRMSPVTLAHLIKKETGLEPILHFTCRDRNVLGIQSELLGAYALNIENVLALTGDPPAVGDYPYLTAVFEVTSKGLIHIIKTLNQGYDLAGNPISPHTNFCIGAAVNPNASNLDREIERFKEKVEAGASFAQTQPLYDINIFKKFLDKISHLKIPILAGVLPLQSYRHAEFLHNEVSGIIIPEGIRERMRNADKPEKEGVLIAQEFLADAKKLVSGVCLMPPFERYDVALDVLRVLKEKRGRKK
ncbi:MAG: bifunctional homocysteine S-methyltransferase/methylenetetrahydrofolate reductase [Candidatus Thermoplasmatota archaeon]|nr:bifunctional homocysteine S-methyltransferase/methylenetetrahydrofolate reductase [Candidatus Thermoplasmatota archaeon]